MAQNRKGPVRNLGRIISLSPYFNHRRFMEPTTEKQPPNG